MSLEEEQTIYTAGGGIDYEECRRIVAVGIKCGWIKGYSKRHVPRTVSTAATPEPIPIDNQHDKK